jgi:hypothetical protein
METKVIEIKNATLVSTSGNPADPEPTTVLVIDAPMTLAMADILKCRYLYTLNDQPVKFEGSIKLPLELGEDEADLALEVPGGGKTTMRPLKIHNFKVSHENDLRLSVEFRSHFKGAADGQQINDFLHAVNKSEFTCWVGSTQGELFPEVLKGDGPAGGKRVDMSPSTGDSRQSGIDLALSEDRDTGCANCNTGIPMRSDGTDYHDNGYICRRKTVDPRQTLASAREANGGTHARKRRSEAAVQ